MLEALDRDVIDQTPEAFYYLSRATFVKDEGLLDRFDQVFHKVFKGGSCPITARTRSTSPKTGWKAVAEKFLTPEEMEKIKSLGDWDEIMETLKKAARGTGKSATRAGNKWVGTGGTSPLRQFGLQPRRRADRRRGQARQGDQGLGKARSSRTWTTPRSLAPRNIKMALRRFAPFRPRRRAGISLDIDATIKGTAKQGLARHSHACRAPQMR